MNYWYLIALSILFNVTNLNTCTAQFNRKDQNPWIIGAYINLINDSGAVLTQPLSFEDNYHYSYPLKISLEKRFEDDFGLELAAGFNRYLAGKRVNGAILDRNINVFASDLALKLYITNLFLDPRRAYVEGYGLLGFGRVLYNRAESNIISGSNTFNLGGGFNIFITEKVRIVLQGIGKLALSDSDIASNYVQYDIGLIYRIQ